MIRIYLLEADDEIEDIERTDLTPEETIKTFDELTPTQTLIIRYDDRCELNVSIHGSASIDSYRNAVSNHAFDLPIEEIKKRVQLISYGKIDELIEREWTHGYGFSPKPNE